MLAISAFSLSPLQAQQGNEAQKAYYTAIAAESAGNISAAKAAYEKALKLNPRHAQARFRLGQLKVNGHKIVAKAQERKIGGVMIPEYRVNDASCPEAVRALGMQIENATKEQKEPVTPNFVIQDPKGELAAAKVTLNMKSIPAGELLNYLLEMAKAKARYDKHAVVIMPR